MSILIGGGTGFVGSALGRALRRKGHRVMVISREPGPLQMTWTELQKEGLPPNVSVVVNTAGENIMSRSWTPEFKRDMWSSRVTTTQKLARAIDAALPEDKPQVFISMSGIGYYPPSETAEYTEESPGGNFDFLSSLVTDWESATELQKSPTVRKVIIRSGLVLGREGGLIQQMYWPFWFFVGGPLGSGQQFFPWIHIRDLVDFIIYTIENPKVNGIYNGVAPQIIRNSEFSGALAKAMWRPSLFRLPVWLLNLVFDKERAKVMTEGQKVHPKRILESGYKFHYANIDEACKECARMQYVDDTLH